MPQIRVKLILLRYRTIQISFLLLRVRPSSLHGSIRLKRSGIPSPKTFPKVATTIESCISIHLSGSSLVGMSRFRVDIFWLVFVKRDNVVNSSKDKMQN